MKVEQMGDAMETNDEGVDVAERGKELCVMRATQERGGRPSLIGLKRGVVGVGGEEEAQNIIERRGYWRGE